MTWSSVTLSPAQIAAGEDDRIRELFTEEWRERALVRDMAGARQLKLPGGDN
jgi:hypothetical protein